MVSLCDVLEDVINNQSILIKYIIFRREAALLLHS